jgi:hypothetical protein
MSFDRELATQKEIKYLEEQAKVIEKAKAEAEEKTVQQDAIYKKLEDKAVELFLGIFKQLVEGGVPDTEAATTARIILFYKNVNSTGYDMPAGVPVRFR